VRLELLSRLLVEAYDRLVSERVPSRVRHRQLKVVYSSPEAVEIVGYSNSDPLRIPKNLLDVLHHFDGRTTEETLREIDEQHDLRVAPGVVRKLVDFEVLAEQEERENHDTL
jgi:hypothetical protein